MATAVAARIGPTDHGRSMTLDEFMESETDEGCRYELARGVLEVTEVPNDPHGQVVSNLYRALARFAERCPGVVRRFGGGSEFRIWLPGMATGRNPDLGVVLQGAPKDQRGRRVPALVGEVVSTQSAVRDYETKRLEYLAFGVLEYWIIDPSKRLVTILYRDGDVWREQFFRDDHALVSLVLPDFATTPAELWIDVEEDDLGEAP
ncbi:MAG: Uma2 family endonuclease [Paludisphaera borealis]|uniref:Uma2 family endonuclease n=1 Tax=Paludisphaera borealis TaxID=1387353 RepID=UPI0028417F87|nr:Uma2 family endonuclease [Paludisphaera borealis]MDR3620757.1 Uma2 family endonuclease [Paludisphaera borealis]